MNVRQNLSMNAAINRRQCLSRGMSGLSSIALASLLAEESPAETPQVDPTRPYAPRPSHFTPKAKNVIVVFCSGALSHVDTFDYKPELIRLHGQPLPGNEKLVSFQGPNGNLTQPLWKFRPRGESGKMTSDLLPHIGSCVDDIGFIHSLARSSRRSQPLGSGAIGRLPGSSPSKRPPAGS